MAEDGTDATQPGLGLRHDVERRRWDRRTHSRFKPDRRRSERRRQRIRTLVLAAAATAATPSMFKKPIAITPGVSVSMDSFRTIPPDQVYDDIIAEAAALHDLDPNLIRAVMRAESAFNPAVVSPVGAQGLMQIMPALAKELGVTDPFDPRQNIMAGSKYLKMLLDAHKGNIALALASYNAGPGNVARYKGVPPFRETRNYVKKITGFLAESTDD